MAVIGCMSTERAVIRASEGSEGSKAALFEAAEVLLEIISPVFFFLNYSQWLLPLSSTNGAKEVAGCGGSRQNH